MPISPFQYQQMLERTIGGEWSGVEPPVEREKDLHDQIINFCAEQPHPWICLHSRTDRRATNNLGTPDFVIVTDTGRVWFVECKRRLGKCSPAQNAMLAWLRKNGANAGVVFSLNEFKGLVKR